jgi:hypothetical protein
VHVCFCKHSSTTFQAFEQGVCGYFLFFSSSLRFLLLSTGQNWRWELTFSFPLSLFYVWLVFWCKDWEGSIDFGHSFRRSLLLKKSFYDYFVVLLVLNTCDENV